MRLTAFLRFDFALSPATTGGSFQRLSRSRRPLRALALLALLAILSIQAPSVALAHATLLRADPAIGGSFAGAPDAITLWFSEPVEPAYSQIQILQSDGSRVVTGELESIADGPDPALRLALPGDLGRGSYTVVWSVLSSVDGHVSEGYFSFTIGDALLPSPATEAALARQAGDRGGVPLGIDAAARWLNLLGQGVIAGLIVFLLVGLLPIADPVPARRWRLLFGAAVAATLTGHVAAALVQTMNATGAGLLDALGSPLVTLLAETRYGALWLARSAVLLMLALLLWLLTRGERLPAPRGHGQLIWNTAGIAASLLLATTSLGSHAAAEGGGSSLAALNDWLHLVAMSVWLGGLAGLVVALPGAGGSLRALLTRFSALALGAAGVLIVTGLVAARREVVSWDGIVATRYGMWFTLKLALVAAALGFGAWHLLVARPALGTSAADRALRGLQRSLRAEALALIGVVAAAALLTATVPARDLLEGDASVFGATRLTAEASVTFRASPGRIGTNELSVVITPSDPAAFGDIEQALLRFTPSDAPGPQSPAQLVQLRQAGSNDRYTFRTTGAYLATAGDWQVTAIVRRTGLPDLEASFDLTATKSGLRPSNVPPSTAADERLSPRALLLGGVWVAAAVALAAGAWWSRRERERRSLSWGLLALALVALMTGSLLIVAGSAVAGG